MDPPNNLCKQTGYHWYKSIDNDRLLVESGGRSRWDTLESQSKYDIRLNLLNLSILKYTKAIALKLKGLTLKFEA